jgi:antitoxin HicB
MKKRNIHLGSDFDDFLKEDGILEEVEARALKRVLALQVQDLMAERKLTKSAMATRMATSRAALQRLLDGENTSVTLGTLHRAARALGRKVKIVLVPA